MANLASQCISCGSREIFFERLCQRCYLESYPVLNRKKELYITACERCELLSIRGQWSNFYLADLGESSINTKLAMLLLQEWEFYYRPTEIQIREIKVSSGNEGVLSRIDGIIDIHASPDAFVPLMTISEDFIINIEWGECSECRTRLTGSYSSKIQIRSPNEVEKKQLEAWSVEIENMSQSYLLTDGKNPLFKIDFLKSGLDALFRSRNTANSVGREFAKKCGGVVSVTTEFSGFDKSKSKEYPRKPVVLITLPDFRPGDIMIFNDKPILILGYDSKVELWDYKKKTKEKIPLKTFIAAKPEILQEEFEEFQLINFEQKGTLAQIMNTNNFETYYIESIEVSDLIEGATFEGILYDGILLRKQKKA
ncbi:MAG: NMD3-related protein [Promethearchaeota archaeon]